mgnify:FL=1
MAVVLFFKKGADPLVKFSVIWLGTFGALTLFRFFANPNFWQDWTSWLYEIEIGLAILIASRWKSSLLSLVVLPVVVALFVYGKLGKPALFSPTLPTGVKSLVKLNEIAGDKRVFMSGSTVFWANSLFDMVQVRGGRDEAAINPLWRSAAYEIREGQDPQQSAKLLKELDVSYVLVHGEDSPEYHYDFKHLEKWAAVGKMIWEERGDAIYRTD